MLDSDGDGIVCYKEFVTWVEKVKTMLGFGSEELGIFSLNYCLRYEQICF